MVSREGLKEKHQPFQVVSMIQKEFGAGRAPKRSWHRPFSAGVARVHPARPGHPLNILNSPDPFPSQLPPQELQPLVPCRIEGCCSSRDGKINSSGQGDP